MIYIANLLNNSFTETCLCHSCASLVIKNQPCTECGAEFDNSVVENTRKRKYVASQLPGIPDKGATQTQTEAKRIWMNNAPASCHLASAQVHRLSGHHPAGYSVQEIAKNPEHWGPKVKNFIDHPRHSIYFRAVSS